MPKRAIDLNHLQLSRAQLQLFTDCPRCFWLVNRHGVKQPKGYPLALNIAMDQLLGNSGATILFLASPVLAFQLGEFRGQYTAMLWACSLGYPVTRTGFGRGVRQ